MSCNPFEKMPLPFQNTDSKYPFSTEIQTKITIFGFTKYKDFGSTFPNSDFETLLQKFLIRYNFFNRRNMKGKRTKGGVHFTATQVNRHFYSNGAAYAAIIRPKVKPDTNWHTIARFFNQEFLQKTHIMSLWINDQTMDELCINQKLRELTLKVLNYECERFWNKETHLPLRETVTEYTDVMVAAYKG